MRRSMTGHKGCSCDHLFGSPRNQAAPVAHRRNYKRPQCQLQQQAAPDSSGVVSAAAGARPAARPQRQGVSSPRQARVKHNTWLNKGGADARGSPFHELGLDRAPLAQVPIKRRNYTLLTSRPSDRQSQAGENAADQQQQQQRQQQQQQQQLQEQHANWADAYADPRLPLAVDVGCGAGRFLLLLAKKDTECRCNYLGLDIQPALVARANAWAAHLGLSRRVHYLQADAAAQLQRLLASYPGRLELVTVQFPDPQNHRDRCAIQPELVHALRQALALDGRVLLQTEDDATALYMRQLFCDHGHGMFFPAEAHYSQQLPAGLIVEAEKSAGYGAHTQHETAAVESTSSQLVGQKVAGLHEGTSGCMPWASAGWLATNPLGAPTERELFVESVRSKPPWQERVYRLLLRKQHQHVTLQ